MVAELKWVHDMIRRDLRTVRQMAADAAAGRAAGEIRAGIRALAASGPLWQLSAGARMTAGLCTLITTRNRFCCFPRCDGRTRP